MWHWLLKVKEMGFSGVNNFPTHCIVDGNFRQVLEETGMSFDKEVEMVGLANKMELFSAVYVAKPEEAKAMTQAGADVVIAHIGTTVGGSIGVADANCDMNQAIARVQAIAQAARSVRSDVIVLSHGGPILSPADAALVNEQAGTVGFVGASSLERIAFEGALMKLTQEFKAIRLPNAAK